MGGKQGKEAHSSKDNNNYTLGLSKKPSVNTNSTNTGNSKHQKPSNSNPSNIGTSTSSSLIFSTTGTLSSVPTPYMQQQQTTSAKTAPEQTLLFSSQSSSKKEMVEMDQLPVKHEVFDVDKKTSINIEKIPAASFVGTIDNEYFTSMACLLKDGTVLTTLHSIFDFEQNEYIELNNLTVNFTHKGYLFTYAVKEIVHDGYVAMRANMSSFDYARLSLVGNPLSDLGGGLELDSQNHFGSASNIDPSQTQAISGPLWYTNKEGQMVFRQLTSLSANEAAQSEYYLFSQEGDHYGNPGFSGQAILYPNTSTLYAIHVGLDNQLNKRTGIKISEYIITHNITLKGTTTTTYKPETVDDILGFQREKLRRKGQDIADLEKFLDQLKQAVDSTNPLNPDDIPALLKLKVVDSHQDQHLQNGYRQGKSYFHPSLATSSDSPVINALANCVNKLVSEYYQRHLKTSNAVQNAFIRRNTKFIVNLDIEVGVHIDSGKKKIGTSCVLIDGFGGKNFHVYPVVPDNLKGSKPVIINASEIINAAKNKLKHYVK